MTVEAIQVGSGVPLPASARTATRSAPSFAGILGEASAKLDAEQATDAARRFVAVTFIEPILAHLRESTFAAGPFAPSAAERRFGPLMDQNLADRITTSEGFPLVDRIRDHLLKQAARRVDAAAPHRMESPTHAA